MACSPNQKQFSEGKEVVAELISIGLLDIDANNGLGLKPLHSAVLHEKYLLVKSLLHNGTDANTRSKLGYTALALAIDTSLPDMVKILLDHKADLHKVCKNKEMSALRLAVRSKSSNKLYQANRLIILDLIFEYGLKSENNLQVDYYRLCKAIVNNDFRASKRLVDRLEDVDFRSIKAENPLIIAAYMNHLEIAELLLKKGVSNCTQQLALCLAIDKRSLKMVKLLLKFKTDVNFFSLFRYKSLKQTPLHQATKNRDIELMKLLLEHGAKVGAFRGYFDTYGSVVETILHLACRDGFSEGVKLLLDNGVQVNAKNSRGVTPILGACDHCLVDNTECVRILLEYGAKITEIDNSKQTILHYIKNNVRSDFVEYVLDLALDRGININARNVGGFTALHHMICQNLVKFLKRGADLNIQSNDGSYPKHSWADYERGLVCPTVDYLKRLQFLGYRIKNPDFMNIVIPTHLSKFYQLELNQLKNVIIAWNPKIRLYDVLFMNRNELLRFSANENLMKALAKSGNDFETKYPYFGSILNVQCRRGRGRKKMTISAESNLQKIFGRTIPDICSNMIFKYLNNYQLAEFENKNFEQT